LDISIAPTLGRIITELLRPALWTLLVIGDRGLVAPDNPGSEPVANESRTSDGETTCPGQIGMAATCGNGYVFDKLLKREREREREREMTIAKSLISLKKATFTIKCSFLSLTF